jgi:hypothetical protein
MELSALERLPYFSQAAFKLCSRRADALAVEGFLTHAHLPTHLDRWYPTLSLSECECDLLLGVS